MHAGYLFYFNCRIRSCSWLARRHLGLRTTDGSINLDHYLYGAPKQQP